MAYQLYRTPPPGNSLQESVDELIQPQQITPQLALQVLLQFDKAINAALSRRVRNRVNFRGSRNTYRFCDNIWTLMLNDVQFGEITEVVKMDKVKIVACDGKNTDSNDVERRGIGASEPNVDWMSRASKGASWTKEDSAGSCFNHAGEAHLFWKALLSCLSKVP